MPREPGKSRTKRPAPKKAPVKKAVSRHKKPAYAKVGTGEDFPTKKPGTKIRETRSGAKVMQQTRASQKRSSKKERPFSAKPLPRGRRKKETIQELGTWHGQDPRSTWPFSTDVRGKPTRDEPWPL